MSEFLSKPNELDESLWGPAPTEDELVEAQSKIAERAERWRHNPPAYPAPELMHPENPHFRDPSTSE